ncbi:MAG TPA: DUF1134 domain-containing protein [Novosphingobium sp.]|nr:DUF1134 domain-containing protein [Novosphingobium sp.]
MRSIGMAAGVLALLVSGMAGGAAPALAQAQQGIDSDLVRPADANAPTPAVSAPPPASAPSAYPAYPSQSGAAYAPPPRQAAPGATPPPGAMQAPPGDTQVYHQDDLIGAAEGVFGKGAKGLADVIKTILKKQGEPNGYIVGREAGGAIAVGLRYGSGTLYHKIEGQMPVYWTGPSIGFDAGASAGKTFVLVYNLYNTDDLYHRFGAGEGQAYFVGGFNVSYLRRDNVVLIPVRLGVGLRLGVNGGYMKITRKSRWFPL